MTKRIHNPSPPVTVPVLLVKHGMGSLCINFEFIKKASGLYRFLLLFFMVGVLGYGKAYADPGVTITGPAITTYTAGAGTFAIVATLTPSTLTTLNAPTIKDQSGTAISFTQTGSATTSLTITSTAIAVPSTPGSYTYTVRVSDNGVFTNPTSKTITITVVCAPIISTTPSASTSTLYLSYPFSGSAIDVSGNSNNGILTGSPAPSLTTDRYGNANSAYLLTNTSSTALPTAIPANQFIETTTKITTINTTTPPFSFSIWFKTTTTNGGKLIDFGDAQVSSNAFDRQLYMDNTGRLSFSTYPGSVKIITTPAATPYNDGNWHHAVATISSTNGGRLYVDNVLQATDATMTAAYTYPAPATGYWHIGYDNTGAYVPAPNSYYFNGSVDDIAIYKTELTTAQINVLYGAWSTYSCTAGLSLQANTPTGGGPYTYSWTGTNGYSSGTLTSPTATVPSSFTPAGTYILTVTNTSTLCTSTIKIAGPSVYTWTGTTSSAPTVATNWTNTSGGVTSTLPPFNGTDNIYIPAVVSPAQYPALTANASINSLTIASGASLNLNGKVLTVGCNIYNSSTGQILSGTGAAINTSGITWSGTTAQTYNGSSTPGTAQIGNMTVNNSTGLTLSGGPVDIYNLLKITSGTLTITAPAVLTLKSTAANTASVDQIAAGSIIGTNSGNVNVERYMTGANVAYRGYRLLSSPVYTGTSAGQNSYDFIALQKTAPITGGGVTGTYPGGTPTGTFDASPTGNPSVFYYYEPNVDPPDKTIPHSDYKGLATINEKLLVGNGFLFYFRGDRSMNDNNNTLPKTATLAVPQNTTLNFTGTLNQGNINVSVPTDVIAANNGTYVTPAGAGNVSTSLSYTNNSSLRDGLHLIGNPYASAIDLDAVTMTNPYSAVNNYVYILNNTGVFGVYIKGSGSATMNNGVGRYVLSGQGFFVRANNTGPATTVSFAETNKVTTVPTAQVPASFASQPSSANLFPQELHVTLALDSLNANEAVVQFGKAKNRFDDREDAYYISGLSQTTFMASYSSDNKPCLFNLMGSLDSIKTIPLYVEGQTTGRYSMTFNGATSIDARYTLFLKDNLLKDSLDLSANNKYEFNIDRANTKTFGDKRFTLVVQATHIQDHYQLTALNATKNTNSISLVWKTVNEGNYVGFNVLRSIDGGKTFAAIGSVQANGSGFYDYTDTNPALGGTNQYKIEQNIDKVTTLSSVVTVSYLTLNANTNKLQVYPNPVASTIKVAVQPEANGGSLVIRIYSVRGELMISNTFTGNSLLSMDVSKLMQGTYVIKVNDNKKNYGSATFTKL